MVGPIGHPGLLLPQVKFTREMHCVDVLHCQVTRYDRCCENIIMWVPYLVMNYM